MYTKQAKQMKKQILKEAIAALLFTAAIIGTSIFLVTFFLLPHVN
jgi:hypothetical protein